jgi:hypothetical protein
MDTLSVSTTEHDDGSFAVRWKWRQAGGRLPSRGGVVRASLHASFAEDRTILVELGVLHHLLCVEQVHGENRLGNGLLIEVSFGAIRKALLKGALKTTDRGDTDKTHVALFGKFIATKFFEAGIEVVPPVKWKAEEPKVSRDYEIRVETIPSVTLPSVLGDVVVSRHALNQFVRRYVAKDIAPEKGPLTAVPDKKWTTAWRNLESLVPNAAHAAIPDEQEARIRRKYGPGAAVLHHFDAHHVFVLKMNPHGLEIVTTMHDEYCPFIPKRPRQMGQRLVYQARG